VAELQHACGDGGYLQLQLQAGIGQTYTHTTFKLAIESSISIVLNYSVIAPP